MRPVRISKKDWSDLLASVNEKAGVEVPIWKAMTTFYDICHESIVTSESIRFMSLYNHLNGTTRETYNSFVKLPPRFIDACDVISDEISRIESFKNGNH